MKISKYFMTLFLMLCVTGLVMSSCSATEILNNCSIHIKISDDNGNSVLDENRDLININHETFNSEFLKFAKEIAGKVMSMRSIEELSGWTCDLTLTVGNNVVLNDNLDMYQFLTMFAEF